MYPPYLVPGRKVSLTLKRFVPSGGNQTRPLPAVACFPYLVDHPRTWILFVVTSDTRCASKKKVTALIPEGFDRAVLEGASKHMRIVFGNLSYDVLPVRASGDISFLANILATCFPDSAASPANAEFTEFALLLRAVASDVVRLSHESGSMDVDLIAANSTAVRALQA